jgi:hypothetical protein
VLLTLSFEPKPDVDDGDLEILTAAQSKGSTCCRRSRTDNEGRGHSVTRIEAILSIGANRVKNTVNWTIQGEAKQFHVQFSA